MLLQLSGARARRSARSPLLNEAASPGCTTATRQQHAITIQGSAIRRFESLHWRPRGQKAPNRPFSPGLRSPKLVSARKPPKTRALLPGHHSLSRTGMTGWGERIRTSVWRNEKATASREGVLNAPERGSNVGCTLTTYRAEHNRDLGEHGPLLWACGTRKAAELVRR